jgi:septal ring factor EnvC (AmiA/AmiB activator)
MSAQPEPAAATSRGRLIGGVALLLLAVAAIAGGAAYGLVSSHYRGAIALKDAAVATHETAIRNLETSLTGLRTENTDLRSRLATAESAITTQKNAIQTLDTSLANLRAENADLRTRLATADATVARSQRPRDPDAIFQMGAEVGRVAGAQEDRASSTVTFETIEGGNFDREKEFEYRDLTLLVKSHKSALTSFTGRGVRTELTGVEATIVRTRPGP